MTKLKEIGQMETCPKCKKALTVIKGHYDHDKKVTIGDVLFGRKYKYAELACNNCGKIYLKEIKRKG